MLVSEVKATLTSAESSVNQAVVNMRVAQEQLTEAAQQIILVRATHEAVLGLPVVNQMQDELLRAISLAPGVIDELQNYSLTL